LKQPAAHAALQHWAADGQPRKIAMHVTQIKTVVEPKDGIGDIAGHRTFSYQFRGKAWEQLIKHFSSPSEKAMRMSSLRNAFARLICERQRIAINKSHFVVIISQRATGQEPTHARADDDRMPAEMRHFADPPLSHVRNRYLTQAYYLKSDRPRAK